MFHPYSFYLQKHKNAKIKRESALPFSASPYYFTSLSIPPMSQTAFYYVPFHHLGYPISPFGMSHFTFWGIPFYHLGCPILPFGVSHFAIWGIFSAHLRTMYSPIFGLPSSFFRCQSLCFFFPFDSSCFFGIRLAG